MLIFDLPTIGNRLYRLRKRMGMTQSDVAEKAGLSDRTYADMERGSVNIRLITLLKVCDVLHITPNEILTDNDAMVTPDEQDILTRLNVCNPKDKETILKILSVYLNSLN